MEYTGVHVYEVYDVWEIVHFALDTHTAWGSCNECCVSCRPITGTAKQLAMDQWTPWVS